MRTTVFIVFIVFLSACGKTNEQEGSNRNIQTTTKTFEYQAPKPKNGKLIAAIEIGSLGLNYFIVSMDSDDNWELVEAEYGRSNLIFDNKNADQLLDDILAFKNEIESKGVNAENIHLVASSSASLLSNLDVLKNELLNEGLTLISISYDMEANCALRASIPKEFMSEAFLVDIGSGNTKFSWTNGTDTTTRESFGSKYYLNNAPDSSVFRKVRDIILEIPEGNRNLCFMIGGMPFRLAEYTDKKKGRYTILQSPGSYPKNGDVWSSGAVIYSAIYLKPTYSYIFVWDSNFVIGYLMTVN